MLADAGVKNALDALVAGIDVPPVRWNEIALRITQPQPVVRRPSRLLTAALATAACLAIAFVAFPASSLGLVRVVVSNYQSVIKVIGWTPPAGAPKATVAPTLQPTLAAAQAHLDFTLVPPSGLPSDAGAAKIYTAPTQVYTKATGAWKNGPAFATFNYERAGGRPFSIMATGFDSETGPPSKYMFESQDLPGGRTALIRHEKFTWRNGNQVMSIVEDDGISAAEIATIRRSMNGIPIEGVFPSRHDAKVIKRFLAPPTQ